MDEGQQETIEREAKAVASRAGYYCFLLTGYATYQIIASGLSLNHKFYTYVPITLGVLGMFGAVFYEMTARSEESGWGIAASKFAGLLPYISGVYMVFFLGLYGLYTLTTDFTVLTLLRSLVFTVIGYRCVSCMWVASELDKAD